MSLESPGAQGVGLPYPTFQNLPIGFHGCRLVIDGRSEREALTPICPTHTQKRSRKKGDWELFRT